jgi:hypothetical protein
VGQLQVLAAALLVGQETHHLHLQAKEIMAAQAQLLLHTVAVVEVGQALLE